LKLGPQAKMQYAWIAVKGFLLFESNIQMTKLTTKELFNI